MIPPPEARRLALAFLLSLSAAIAGAAPAQDPLLEKFRSPPQEAKPRVWWHWMNGNITQEGIRLDLEWMHRVGIGGVQNFDASLGGPTVVEQPLKYMTPAWNQATRYAVSLASSLGMEFGIAGSPGFSESGGPWVIPEEGMKKLVWSELLVTGGTPLTEALLKPPDTIGPFQNIPINWSNPLLGRPPVEPVENLYRDVAVIAYRRPEADQSPAELHPTVQSSAGAIDSSLLWDGDLAQPMHLPLGDVEHPAWLRYDFGHPQTVQSLTLVLQRLSGMEFFIDPAKIDAELMSSDDGITFHRVCTVYQSSSKEQTLTFAPVTARYFRLELVTPEIPDILKSLLGSTTSDHQIAEFVLHTTPRVDHFEQKAAFFVGTGLDEEQAPPAASARDLISLGEILNLTSRLRPDGTLDWTPPPGRWTVLRFGYSLIGMTNHPASVESTGLEVDKLSRAAVRSHMQHYLGKYDSILPPGLMGARGLHAMVNDSWEAGAQNWTDDLPAQFSHRRGYELWSWMPALTGQVIDSVAATDKFLWDFRRTLEELVAENHFGEIAAALHERKMIYYDESHEYGRAFFGDGMDAKKYGDVPMGAMWVGDFRPQEPYDADLLESASVAHIYGQHWVAAESMTAFGSSSGYAYSFAPDNLKATADREMADGVNRFVIHASVHQPSIDRPPGMALGPFGQWFTRNETWAEQATPWVKYLARSSFLLQQGRFVADVIYFYGQDSNITALYGKGLPAVPKGYAFDFASADALKRLSVRDAILITASGMQYRLLALDPRTRVMSLDVLKRLAQLVNEGATILGDKPQVTPSLSDDSSEFHALADALWGATSGTHRYGRGQTLSGLSIADGLAQLGVSPDVSFPDPSSDVRYVHRKLSTTDAYFISNRQDRANRVELSFRIAGHVPELWHADSGRTESVSYRMDGERTTVPLNLDPFDAVFVVFRQTRERERQIAELVRRPLETLDGPWTVQFQPDRGAPREAVFTNLKSWSEDADPKIRYFSGTASYDMSLVAPTAWLAHHRRIEIDLGTVKNLAEILVNGRSAGIAWKPPYRLDVTALLWPGTNHVSIRVTNLWPNRMIGDHQPGARKIAFASFDPFKADSPLLPSGLLGPVTVFTVTGQ
jgi:(4-O-methyl)-D-glucuronate---lignin esterase